MEILKSTQDEYNMQIPKSNKSLLDSIYKNINDHYDVDECYDDNFI